ncbi:MAG: plasma-membrane proton-efflux P-type ATPase [Anaerolinea sp.]|nr:plasma-membrane proton-efflux P-type ATPase [Anaerolinea sp.]
MQSPSSSSAGLTSAEAERLLSQYGPNALGEAKKHPVLDFLKRLWGPIPWMLETVVVLQVVLGKYDEALIIAALLLFNAVFSAWQEKRSSDALAMLRQRLQLTARVCRDGQWQTLPAEQLVPGDVIHIRMGDLLPADVQLLDGRLLLDQSALTGESLPVEAVGGGNGYTGTVVQHGEATATVTATGTRTRFGRTAELVRSARHQTNLEKVIFSITKSLILLDGVLALAVMAYAVWVRLPLLQILPFALILLVASVPVALPATFAVATALGARELSHQGVLVTHLAAIEEAAGMDALCTDKTGTITENRLSVAALRSYAALSEEDLLHLAAMACDPSTQDALDLAILGRAEERRVSPDFGLRQQFLPFDPATKRSEAFFQQKGVLLHVAKGAPHAIAPLCDPTPPSLEADVEALAAQGYRVLAVAHGEGNALQMSGLVAFQDPPRPDSVTLIGKLRELGIRVVMITGDGLATARAIARQVGIGDHACSAQSMQAGSEPDPTCDVFAEVLPEHKFALVQALQNHGHITGMTGDGVNDAPALKQAQVGIAVSTATDVAKAAASLVLVQPGLTNILSAIQVSRQIYQRMLTYTLNKIIKTIQVAGFLSLGLILTGSFVTTPLLVILLIFANDFVTMSIASDQVRASPQPDRWDVRALLVPALSLALPTLALTFGIFLVGRNLLHLPLGQLQTLSFITLVFTAQGMIYLVRERHHVWASRPGKWMMLASALDILVVILLASFGLLMQAIPLWLTLATLAVITLVLLGLDFFKVWLFQVLHLR